MTAALTEMMSVRPISPAGVEDARAQLFTVGNELVNEATPGCGSFPDSWHAGNWNRIKCVVRKA